MSPEAANGDLRNLMADLPSIPPSRRTMDATRMRCHATLGHQNRRRRRASRLPLLFQQRVLEPAIVIAASVLFLSEVAVRALDSYRR